MRSKAMLAILTALILAVSLICGCSSSSESSSSQRDNSLSSSQVKIVVDAWGRSVKVPVDAQTAATVGSAARIVIYAGAQDKLIAVGEIARSHIIGMPYTIAAEEIFKDLPETNTGSNYLVAGDIDTQALIDLHPDVIISSSSADACDALQEETGIPVIGIFYQNQLFTPNVIDSIECVAEALGTESHAQAVIAKLQAWQKDLNDRTAKISQETDLLAYFGGVAYFEGHNWYGTYANYAPAVAANIRCAANEIASDGYVEVTIEQIAKWNPDFMFINDNDYENLKQSYDQNRALFDGITAFQKGQIYTQPFCNYNGTNIEMGICDAYFSGAMVYPEAFSDVDLDAMYTDIFETMLDGYDFYTTMTLAGDYFGKFPSLQ